MISVIFLTTAEMLNTVLLPHKIIFSFFFEDSPYDINNVNDVDYFVKELDDYCTQKLSYSDSEINFDIVILEGDTCPKCGGKLYFKKGIEKNIAV